jgi:hypothetical protein
VTNYGHVWGAGYPGISYTACNMGCPGTGCGCNNVCWMDTCYATVVKVGCF